MRSEATAHRHRDPPPHNKYGKSQVHKTRNDLIDTISKVIYRSWLCLPFITHFGQVLFRSFPSSRVAVRVNLLLFVLKDLVRHWECSQIPSPRMFLLYSVFHTHFLCHLAHIYCLGAGRRCLVPKGKPLPSPYLTPSPFPAWKHIVSYKPRPDLALDKATFLHLAPGSLPKPYLDTPQASSLSTVPTRAPLQG